MALVITLDTTGLEAGEDKIVGATLLDADSGKIVFDSNDWKNDKQQAKKLIDSTDDLIIFNYDFVEAFLTEEGIDFDNYTDMMENISDEIDPKNGKKQSLKKCVEYYGYKNGISTRQQKAEAILFCYNQYYKSGKKKNKSKKLFWIFILIIVVFELYQLIK